MTRKPRDYRIRVAQAGVTQVSGNVAFSIDTVGTETDGWLAERGLTRWGGQRVKPLDGAADSSPWTVTIGESQAGEEFVAHIADSGGRAHLMRRLLDVSVSTDGGTTWTVQATARITDVRTKRPGVWRVTCVDERLVERETELFATTSTTAIWPMGPREPFANVATAGAAQYEVELVDTINGIDFVRLGFDDLIVAAGDHEGDFTQLATLNTGVRDAIREDLKDDIKGPNDLFPGGAFDEMRADVFAQGADLTNLNNRVATQTLGSTVTPIAGTSSILKGDLETLNVAETKHADYFSTIRLIWENNLPSVGAKYWVRFYFLNHETTNTVPRHVGGSGTHAMELAKDLYTLNDIRIDSAAFDALIANQEIPEVAFRVTGPQRMDQWLEENIYQPFGISPIIDAEGRIAPKRVSQVDADEVPDVTTLTNLDGSVVARSPAWRNATTEQVTRLEFEWQPLGDQRRRGGTRSASAGADGLAPDTKTVTRDHDRRSQFGTKTRRVSLRGIHQKGLAKSVADGMARRIYNRYGDGAIRTEGVPALSAADAAAPGEFVTLDLDVYPDAQSASYTGARLLQVVGQQHTREPGRGSVILDLLDAGPKLQPLSKPTLTAAQNADDPASAIDVTVSNLPSGAGYLLQQAKSATEPATDSSLWHDAATGDTNETVTIGGLASDTTYWFRARSTQQGRLSSLWSDAVSATTAALTAPSNLQFSEVTGCSFVVTWAVGETDRPVTIEVVGGNVDYSTQLDATTTRKEIHDGLAAIEVSTTYTVTVSHVDGAGGTASVSADVTTTATPDVGPDPLGISVLIGRDIQD